MKIFCCKSLPNSCEKITWDYNKSGITCLLRTPLCVKFTHVGSSCEPLEHQTASLIESSDTKLLRLHHEHPAAAWERQNLWKKAFQQKRNLKHTTTTDWWRSEEDEEQSSETPSLLGLGHRWSDDDYLSQPTTWFSDLQSYKSFDDKKDPCFHGPRQDTQRPQAQEWRNPSSPPSTGIGNGSNLLIGSTKTKHCKMFCFHCCCNRSTFPPPPSKKPEATNWKNPF